jgi:hypothetical protein
MARPETVAMLFNNFFKRRRNLVISALALVVTAIIFSGYIAIRSDQHRPVTVWTSTQNDVEVKISILKYPSGQMRLSGTFTPTRPGFYLYGKDLPKTGLQGLGRPTLLEVQQTGSIKITGALEADQPIKNIYVNALDISFPVYPAGPVTLSIPFEPAGNPAFMELSITYMACSDKTCLPPVINKRVYIQVPEKFFDQ